MGYNLGEVELLTKTEQSDILAREEPMKNKHRGGGTVGDLGRLTFGMTAFLKTCNRSSVLNTGPVTGHTGG